MCREHWTAHNAVLAARQEARNGNTIYFAFSPLSLCSRTCWGLRKSVHLGQKLANFMYFFGCVFFRKSSYKCAASSSVSHVLPMRFDEYFAPQDAPDVRMTPRNRDSLDRKVVRCYTRGRKEK